MRFTIPIALSLLVAACDVSVTPQPVQPVPSGPSTTVAVMPVEAPDAPPSDGTPAFERLGPARPGEWRHQFPDELPLDFDEYVASDPVRASDHRRVVAFQPAGEFAPDEQAVLDAATAFTGIWFDLPVATLDPVRLTDDSEQWRDRGDVGDGRQFHTRWFLNALLPDRVPDDAVVLLGVTMADLWPGGGWNFVFGQANLRRRVGVYSLARYFPAFYGDEATPDAARLAVRRALQVVVHEAGHTFGLEHCVTWACAMNGTNSLGETDASPLYLCPDCLRKLAWNRGFDVRHRHARLAEALAAHSLVDDAAWHRARAALAR